MKQVRQPGARLAHVSLDHGKQLLKLLVSEIRVGTTNVTLAGSRGVLADAVSEMKLGTSLEEVPSIVMNWRARDDEDGHWSEHVGWQLVP